MKYTVRPHEGRVYVGYCEWCGRRFEAGRSDARYCNVNSTCRVYASKAARGEHIPTKQRRKRNREGK